MPDIILLQWSDESDIKTSIDEDRQTISLEEWRFCLHETQGNEKKIKYSPCLYSVVDPSFIVFFGIASSLKLINKQK